MSRTRSAVAEIDAEMAEIVAARFILRAQGEDDPELTARMDALLEDRYLAAIVA